MIFFKKSCKIPTNELVGWFGAVQVIRRWDRKHDLIGGSESEQRLVRAWCERNASFLEFAEPGEEIVLVLYVV